MDRAEAIRQLEWMVSVSNAVNGIFAEACSMAITALREQEQGEMKIQSLEMSLKIACDALEKFTKAEQEGRLVVLPCKVGTPVFRIIPKMCERREKDTCDSYCDGWEPNHDCYVGGNQVGCGWFRVQDADLFGKAVFLTREEAELALRCEHETST